MNVQIVVSWLMSFVCVNAVRAGYCCVNLRSAIEFILVMDGPMVSIPDDEFQR